MIMTHPTWTYQGRLYTELSDFPEGTYGFIYEVKHIPTGTKYIGKKVLFFERNKKLGKKALEELKEERKARGIGGRTPLKQKVISESDWKSYYGSHKDILQLVKESEGTDWQRKILYLVSSKKLLTYFECKYLFINEVLENRDNYINDNVLGKFYRKDFDI
jgi:serine/threonine protein kinase